MTSTGIAWQSQREVPVSENEACEKVFQFAMTLSNGATLLGHFHALLTCFVLSPIQFFLVMHLPSWAVISNKCVMLRNSPHHITFCLNCSSADGKCSLVFPSRHNLLPLPQECKKFHLLSSPQTQMHPSKLT